MGLPIARNYKIHICMLNQQKKEWPAQWEDSQADELN